MMVTMPSMLAVVRKQDRLKEGVRIQGNKAVKDSLAGLHKIKHSHCLGKCVEELKAGGEQVSVHSCSHLQ